MIAKTGVRNNLFFNELPAPELPKWARFSRFLFAHNPKTFREPGASPGSHYDRAAGSASENNAGDARARATGLRGDAANPANGVGVIVLEGGKALAGRRSDDGTVGGPGGRIGPGETPAQAAIREAQEEFGITPTRMELLGRAQGLGGGHGSPYVYLCTGYEAMAGKPACLGDGMTGPFWVDLGPEAAGLFPPLAESLRMLEAEAEARSPKLEAESRSSKPKPEARSPKHLARLGLGLYKQGMGVILLT